MTKAEFMEKYGDWMVSFASYYRYQFTFSANTEDGGSVYVQVGGNADEIYRFYVAAGDMCKIKDLDPNFVVVRDKNGNLIAMFSE